MRNSEKRTENEERRTENGEQRTVKGGRFLAGDGSPLSLHDTSP